MYLYVVFTLKQHISRHWSSLSLDATDDRKLHTLLCSLNSYIRNVKYADSVNLKRIWTCNQGLVTYPVVG